MQSEPILFHSAAGTVLVDSDATTHYLGSARDEELLRADPPGVAGDSEAVRYYAIWHLPAHPDKRGHFAMSRNELGNLINAAKEGDRGSARIARCCCLEHAQLKYESEAPGPRRQPP